MTMHPPLNYIPQVGVLMHVLVPVFCLILYAFVLFSFSVSLPHLVDFDWRVDVKTSSDSAARMAQPTCIVQMKVRSSIAHDRSKTLFLACQGSMHGSASLMKVMT